MAINTKWRFEQILGEDFREKAQYPWIIKQFSERGDAVYRSLYISDGMSECGFDVTLRSAVVLHAGETSLGCTDERVNMPNDVCAILKTKSTLARLGVYVSDPMIDPKFKGHITLEIVYFPLHDGPKTIELPGGMGIACMVLQGLTTPAEYNGKYDGRKGVEPAR